MQLTDYKGGGQQARFYIDGVRVSREKYEHVEQQGYMFGRVDCFHTQAWPVGTKTRRRNDKHVTLN